MPLLLQLHWPLRATERETLPSLARRNLDSVLAELAEEAVSDLAASSLFGSYDVLHLMLQVIEFPDLRQLACEHVPREVLSGIERSALAHLQELLNDAHVFDAEYIDRTACEGEQEGWHELWSNIRCEFLAGSPFWRVFIENHGSDNAVSDPLVWDLAEWRGIG